MTLGRSDGSHHHSPPPSECTYSATLLIVAASSRVFQFGITPIRGLVICATIDGAVVAIQVHVRRQPRRALLAIALPCLAVADRAVVGEELLARR